MTQSIGRKELLETLEFLENIIKASGSDWGDKLVSWRVGQYGIVEEEFREWVNAHAEQVTVGQAMFQIAKMIRGEYPPDTTQEEVDLEANLSIAKQAVVHGVMIGMELHRRYCT